MSIEFYDSNGGAYAYTEDDETIYTYTGEPVAYFDNGSVYSFNGNHLGYFENGFIWDKNGYALLFSSEATGGPMKPMKHMKPMKSMKHMKPMKHMKKMKPMCPTKKLSWSQNKPEDIFE